MTYHVVPMFPYPSGHFHMGHARNYIFSDIIRRFLDITNKEIVKHCLGIDAFGLPAENAAIKYNLSPKEWTKKNVEHIVKSLKDLNIEYNTDVWINTSKTNFIRLNQFIFQILFKNGIIYSSETYVNWDPEDNTVLSNEQVIDGKGWRSGVNVQKKIIKAWYVNISKYASKLKEELKYILNWPTQIKKIQNNWINKVNGFIIKFEILSNKDYKEYILCFTKKPECCFNAKFIAISYTHELAVKYITNNNIEIDNISIKDICIKTDIKCINPYNNEILDVYIAGYVVHNFATKALYGAPNIDDKDEEFARKANISFIDSSLFKEDYSEDIINNLKINNIIYPTSIYTLNDWCISRQRVWGCPIPILYCDLCGPIVVVDDYLNNIKLNFNCFNKIKNSNIKYNCTKCLSPAKVEIETLDTFFDSSWYYLCYLSDGLHYLNNLEDAENFLRENIKKLPLNIYIGGIEHANLHLIYTRAMITILQECLNTGYILPIDRLIAQGSVLHNAYLDKNNKYIDGKVKEEIAYTRMEKMSKSKLNIVSIEEMLNKFNSDVIRFAIMSNMPIEVSYEWEETIFYKKYKFLLKLANILDNFFLVKN